MTLLRRIDPEVLRRRSRRPVDPETLNAAAAIVEDIRVRGETALLDHAQRLGDIGAGDPVVRDRHALEAVWNHMPTEDQGLLQRVHRRIERFAEAQRATFTDLAVQVEGGEAGHRWIPVAGVGAYAPGGRHPLPSTVLMTVTPARVAGVETVWVASPRPASITMAAAFIAGADGLLAVGGAQAIAALAFGTVTPASDLIVGPGNRWVTAAKKHLYGEVGIDALAGPSEILVIADESANPSWVAADLLAQAEHDPDAIPILVTTAEGIIEQVDAELTRQLTDLPTAETARVALTSNGHASLVFDLTQAASLANRLAPEHLALHVIEPDALAGRLTSYGSLFIGDAAAEAFADYGAGPNHVLPTGGTARHTSGLSVGTFLRSPTWLRLEDPRLLAGDTERFGESEGLTAHARAATARAVTE